MLTCGLKNFKVLEYVINVIVLLGKIRKYTTQADNKSNKNYFLSSAQALAKVGPDYPTGIVCLR